MSDLFGWLPPAIRNSRWLREGHNSVKEKTGEYAREHPVLAAKRANRVAVKAAQKNERTVTRAGGDVAAAQAATRTAYDKRTNDFVTARANPESAHSERVGRRGIRKQYRQGLKDQR